jgi:hypothetical protein
MADTVSALGESPIDIQVRAAYAAGTALQAAFMIDRNTVFCQAVNIGRAEIQAGLFPAFIPANCIIFYLEMALLINLESIQK